MNAKHGSLPARQAFTLVELLVVIGIIALLMGILMPALGRARAAADGVKCLSNLKQINMAMIMFAQDHGGRLPQMGTAGTGTEVIKINGVDQTVLVRWFGGMYGSKFYEPAAMLAPYWGTASIGGCPALQLEESSRPQYGEVDYAYNSIYAKHKEWVAGGASRTGKGVVLAAIAHSSEKALVWDAARLMGSELDRTPWGYPTTGNVLNDKTDPNFHGRHNKYGNVGWADGHASVFRPSHFSSYNGGQNAALLREFNIGDIDSDFNQTTNEHYSVE